MNTLSTVLLVVTVASISSKPLSSNPFKPLSCTATYTFLELGAACTNVVGSGICKRPLNSAAGCVASKCTEGTGAVGQPCNEGVLHNELNCNVGLDCVNNKCVTIVVNTTTPACPTTCPACQSCVAGSGVCTSTLQAVGASCSMSCFCNPATSFCSNYVANGTCTALRGNDQPCTTTGSECASGTCIPYNSSTTDGKCYGGATGAENDKCGASTKCNSGLECNLRGNIGQGKCIKPLSVDVDGAVSGRDFCKTARMNYATGKCVAATWNVGTACTDRGTCPNGAHLYCDCATNTCKNSWTIDDSKAISCLQKNGLIFISAQPSDTTMKNAICCLGGPTSLITEEGAGYEGVQWSSVYTNFGTCNASARTVVSMLLLLLSILAALIFV